MGTTQILNHDANGVTFADPTEPDFTVRFKTTNNKKSLNGVSIDNYLTEIIVNDANDITIGATSAVDALSIRIRVSGSIKSQDRVKAIVKSLASQLPAWCDENTFLGFEPSTVPLSPSV